MPFLKAIVDFTPAATGTGLKVSLRKRKGSTGRATMAIALSAATMRTVGLADGDGVEVLIGTGSDLGVLRFRKNNSAAASTKARMLGGNGKTYLGINLGHQAAFPDRFAEARWCKWETITDDDGQAWVEVALPDWAKPAPAAPPTSREIINRAAAAVPAPPTAPGRVAVTSKLLGDPDPGRKKIMDDIDAGRHKETRR